MYKYVRYINYVSIFVSFMQNHKWYFYFFIYKTWKETENFVINIQEIEQTVQFTILIGYWNI